MAQLIIPYACQVTIRMECSGQEVVNVIGVNGNFDESAISIAGKVRTAWEATGGPLSRKPSSVKMIGYKVTRLTPDGDIGELTSAATGGAASGSLSTMASSALVILGGGTRARSSRGRLYHGPLSEADINADGRTLAPAFQSSIAQSYIQFRTQMRTAGPFWCVLSRKNSSATEITTLSVASVIATQRRRQR